MERFKNVAELVESAKYSAALFKKVNMCGKKIEGYEVQNFYPSDSSRQAWVLKRNEAINEALVEAQKWVYLTGVVIPPAARSWQEDVQAQLKFLLSFNKMAVKVLIELQKKNG